MREKLKKIVAAPSFTYFITILILINSILIGVEIDAPSIIIGNIQAIILYLFTLEIFIRMIGRVSWEEYFKNGWNYFDIFLVSLAYIPESMLANPEVLTAMRILRVFRVFRLFKAFKELRVIAKVLIKSMSSLTYVSMFMGIFLYLFAIMGVILFKGKSQVETANGLIDPYGSISEAMFSLFRALTAEDWTDLRYNLLSAPGIPDLLPTLFHVVWFLLSAFLLINIVVGAIVNNYDAVMAEADKEAKSEDDIQASLIQIQEKLTEVQNELEAQKRA